MATVTAARGNNNRRHASDVAKQSVEDETDDQTRLCVKTESKQALKVAEHNKPTSSDGNSKYQIRYDQAGNMFYRKDDRNAWEAAVFHDDIRARLLEETDRLGTYDYPRAKGENPLDRTSYLASQKSWGFASRNQWPDVLNAIFPPDKRPRSRAQHWYDNGRIVLDPDNHPVKSYTEIPLTCAEAMEGALMEAIRRTNAYITHKDFRARMPNKKHREGYPRPLCVVTALSNRQWRFRTLTGSLCWDTKAGSDTIRRFMVELYPASCLESNCSKGFRDLTKEELKGISLLNKDLLPERAGARALDPHTEPDVSLQDVRAGKKRRRDHAPLLRGIETNIFAEEEEIGDTIIVSGIIASPIVEHRRKRTRRSEENTNRHRTAFSDLDHQDNVAVDLPPRRHRRRNQSGISASMISHHRGTSNRSSLFALSPGYAPDFQHEYNRNLQHYQPYRDQRHQPNLYDVESDGLSLAVQHHEPSQYAYGRQLPIATEHSDQSTNSRPGLIPVAGPEIVGEERKQEEEKPLELIDPQFRGLAIPTPGQKLPPARVTEATSSSVQFIPSQPLIPSIEVDEQPRHNAHPGLDIRNGSDASCAPMPYYPRDDSPIDFQTSAEESILWLSRHRTFI
ncbi:MAG: hypothetical protein Q9187_001434 [Circinaria calcarea]